MRRSLWLTPARLTISTYAPALREATIEPAQASPGPF